MTYLLLLAFGWALASAFYLFLIYWSARSRRKARLAYRSLLVQRLGDLEKANSELQEAA